MCAGHATTAFETAVLLEPVLGFTYEVGQSGGFARSKVPKCLVSTSLLSQVSALNQVDMRALPCLKLAALVHSFTTIYKSVCVDLWW